MKYLMLYALAPLAVAVGIALVFDRWNMGREGTRREGANRRRRLRL